MNFFQVLNQIHWMTFGWWFGKNILLVFSCFVTLKKATVEHQGYVRLILLLVCVWGRQCYMSYSSPCYYRFRTLTIFKIYYFLFFLDKMWRILAFRWEKHYIWRYHRHSNENRTICSLYHTNIKSSKGMVEIDLCSQFSIVRFFRLRAFLWMNHLLLCTKKDLFTEKNSNDSHYSNDRQNL